MRLLAAAAAAAAVAAVSPQPAAAAGARAVAAAPPTAPVPPVFVDQYHPSGLCEAELAAAQKLLGAAAAARVCLDAGLCRETDAVRPAEDVEPASIAAAFRASPRWSEIRRFANHAPFPAGYPKDGFCDRLGKPTPSTRDARRRCAEREGSPHAFEAFGDSLRTAREAFPVALGSDIAHTLTLWDDLKQSSYYWGFPAVVVRLWDVGELAAASQAAASGSPEACFGGGGEGCAASRRDSARGGVGDSGSAVSAWPGGRGGRCMCNTTPFWYQGTRWQPPSHFAGDLMCPAGAARGGFLFRKELEARLAENETEMSYCPWRGTSIPAEETAAAAVMPYPPRESCCSRDLSEMGSSACVAPPSALTAEEPTSPAAGVATATSASKRGAHRSLSELAPHLDLALCRYTPLSPPSPPAQRYLMTILTPFGSGKEAEVWKACVQPLYGGGGATTLALKLFRRQFKYLPRGVAPTRKMPAIPDFSVSFAKARRSLGEAVDFGLALPAAVAVTPRFVVDAGALPALPVARWRELQRYVAYLGFGVLSEQAECDVDQFAARSNLGLNSVRKISADVLAGLLAVERLGYVWMDLKPQNLLIAAGKAKVGDIGFMRPINEVSKMPGIGTPGFRPFEAFVPGQRTAALTQRRSAFALGVTIYQLLFGVLPWNETQIKRLAKSATTLEAWQLDIEGVDTQTIPQNLLNILVGLLHPNPRRRWTLERALSTEYFAPYVAARTPELTMAEGGYGCAQRR